MRPLGDILREQEERLMRLHEQWNRMPAFMRAAVDALVVQDRKITAIQFVRQITFCSLRDAKVMVEHRITQWLYMPEPSFSNLTTLEF